MLKSSPQSRFTARQTATAALTVTACASVMGRPGRSTSER